MIKDDLTMNPDDLGRYIQQDIQGVFSPTDIVVLRDEVKKLKPGQIYLEIGVDEGRSMAVAYYYAQEGVHIIGVDIHNVDPHELSVGRGKWMEEQGMIGIDKYCHFIHGDEGTLSKIWNTPIDLLFLDPHHDYESIKRATLNWEPKVKKGGVILFHDYDHGETKDWLDERYGDDKEVFHTKIVRVYV